MKLLSRAMAFLLVCGLLPEIVMATPESDCRDLRALTNSAFSVVTAELMPAADQLPEHCRVHGFIQPAINFEVRLPTDWNRKFYMVGNGGYLGVFFDQSYGLARGYATASTDTGHEGPSPTFALNNRAAEIDFGFRAIHLTTVASKAIIDAYYDREPQYSYYRGCSTGGRQGLMEAQRFPDDFDGWSIGAPIYDYTDKQTYNAAWAAKAMFGNNQAGHVPIEQLQLLGEAVYAQCDAIDGLEDGLINDPRECDFDARRDLPQCSNDEQSMQCFTPAQIGAIAKIYEGPGEGVYPGAAPGGEWMPHAPGRFYGGWDLYFTGIPAAPASADGETNSYGGNVFEPVQLRNGSSFFRYLAFEEDQPEFDILTDLDFDDVPDVSFMAGIMNATDTDLSRVHDGGKKIILWHGWADVGLNPLRTIEYFEDVQATMGEPATDEFMRLFLVPGMYHCDAGPGPDVFDDLSALEQWVEQGDAPDEMTAYQVDTPDGYGATWGNVVAPHADVERSRPICAYPAEARYRGRGNANDADNFECVSPSAP